LDFHDTPSQKLKLNQNADEHLKERERPSTVGNGPSQPNQGTPEHEGYLLPYPQATHGQPSGKQNAQRRVTASSMVLKL
ncbi:hypothetical protein AB4Z38_25125, partial [Arthrobacter sp. 2RAF6]|uniref:hypothetical protein n=1 Tax=Arthrobacter sp. 2RAF6 TaxID=3233002 RepID=UPI003F925D3C